MRRIGPAAAGWALAARAALVAGLRDGSVAVLLRGRHGRGQRDVGRLQPGPRRRRDRRAIRRFDLDENAVRVPEPEGDGPAPSQ